jgi:hypothetical protein
MQNLVAATFRRIALAGLLATAGCIDSYLPQVASPPTGYLVVDGFINGNGRTRIKLSRSISIAATTTPPVEKNAQLFLLDDTGKSYALTEKTSGSYQSDSLVLSAARQYQLRITTAGNSGTTYESDFVPLKVAPPIDKLTWRTDSTQVDVQVSTRDPSGQSRYYRWGFVETWEFHSAFESLLEYDQTQKVIVKRINSIYTCWRTERPTTIRQTSTVQLAQDALTDQAILRLSGRNERLQIRYSVLVGQYTETAQEFAYYELLRKNTEAVGSVNDPLPTQLTGNVHRVDKTPEPVLGYVGAHTTQYKRLFINRQDLPAQTTARFDSPYADCILGYEDFCDRLTGVCIAYPQTRLFFQPNAIPIDRNYNPPGYTGGTPECVDCRYRGSITKPSFW